jgi:HKD family nuclease
MATAEFILQGFTASTHVDVLQRLFDLPDIQRVLVSVAFVTEGGVAKIEPQMIPHASRATVFAGIRNDSTTYQGLVRLHGIVGQLYAVDTGSRTLIFHPKLYLVRGSKRARLVVGSANLTLAGLNNNIEAGMLLDFDLADVDDKALIDNIETLFAASVTDYPQNVIKVGSLAYLDELLAANRLVDEQKVLRHRNAAARIDSMDSGDDDRIDSDNDGDGIPRIKLKVRLLQSGIIKDKIKPNEPDGSKAMGLTLAPKMTPEAISPLIPVSGVELEPEDTATNPIHYYFRKSRRKGDGPRLRAARAKAEAIRNGKKWYRTGDPCVYGHYADRLVSNGKCRECNRLDCERSNRLGLYR